jgi:AraC-like DNA-binding protein
LNDGAETTAKIVQGDSQMDSSVQHQKAPPHAEGDTMLAFDRASCMARGGSQPLACPVSLPFEAVIVLEDVRRAMERNRPEGARIAALRLVSLLTPPVKVESVCARGGLAPWQQRKIDRYLREHLERSIQIEELAKQLPLSVSHFCRAFKETFGTTPHAYLIRLRLEAAQEMMLTTAEPLSQIALASGFGDQAHLSKQFRRTVGETPSAWRRRNLTEAQAEATSRSSFIGRELQLERN